MAIDLKQAVKTALNFVENIFGSASSPTVEELELDQKNNLWLVTIGFSRTPPPNSTLSGALAHFGALERSLKVVAVDADSGEVKSMKIRPVIGRV